jgi:hypothetical protein
MVLRGRRAHGKGAVNQRSSLAEMEVSKANYLFLDHHLEIDSGNVCKSSALRWFIVPKNIVFREVAFAAFYWSWFSGSREMRKRGS